MSGKDFADSDYALMDYSETYSEFDDISEQLSKKVFERDGRKWWLCNSEVDLVHIMRQIDDLTAFSRFRENAIIPSLTANPSHPENLFPFVYIAMKGTMLLFLIGFSYLIRKPSAHILIMKRMTMNNVIWYLRNLVQFLLVLFHSLSGTKFSTIL